MDSFDNRTRILLVNPKTPASYWGMQESAWFIGARAAHIPLSLITIAALLPNGWDLKLVDMNVERLEDRDIETADAVLLTGMIIQRESLAEVLRRCADKGVPTLVGGPFASSTPEAPELAEATSLFVGEAEEVMGDICADISAGALKPRYRSERRPEMDVSPIPRFDLLRRDRYCAMSLQMSRGCPHGCEFCNVRILFGRRPRYKSPARVTAELDAIRATGFRGNVFFVDDNFIGNPRHAAEILKAVRKWQETNGYPFLFFTEADIRLAQRDEMIRLMTAAGFFAVFIGFESPSEEALRCSAKRQNVGVDIVAAVRHLRQNGLLVYGGFIVGFDTDGPDSSELTYKLIEECGIDFAMAGMLIAIPGTPLERRLREEGRLLTNEAATGNQCELANILPKRMSRLELVTGYRQLMERLYRPERYFKRAYAALSEWRQCASRLPTRQEVLAVFRSVVRQGVFSRYSRHYWQFIMKTLFRFPNKFPRAFAMAICGHHLFRYTEREVIPRLKEAELKLAAT